MATSTAQPARPVIVHCPFCSAANRVDLTRLASGPKCAKCGKPLRLDRPQKVTDKDFELARKMEEVIMWQPGKEEGSALEGTPDDPRFKYVKYD